MLRFKCFQLNIYSLLCFFGIIFQIGSSAGGCAHLKHLLFIAKPTFRDLTLKRAVSNHRWDGTILQAGCDSYFFPFSSSLRLLGGQPARWSRSRYRDSDLVTMLRYLPGKGFRSNFGVLQIFLILFPLVIFAVF